MSPLGLEIAEELGRGAQTVVYRARRQGVDYALKMLRRSVYADDAAWVAFRREAATLTSVAHRGLTRIHEVGQVDGRPYLVMELLEGQTLAALLEAGPLDEARAAEIVVDVADALAAAHRAGLVHRDIKPDNIMILPTGQAKVIDFGLAAREDTHAPSEPGAVAATFAYAAPEQTGMLRRLVDGRSDLYALGVVLFQCVTGELPFTAADVGELMRQHAVTPAPDVREVNPGRSPALAAIVAKLLAKDPDDRYQTGTGLAADLARLPGTDTFPLGGQDRPGYASDIELVGRESEVATLLGRWHEARRGHGGVALVRGAPGAGKSRLVREVLTAAAEGDALLLRGKCEPDDPVPLAPVRMAIDRYLNGVQRLPEPQRTEAIARVRAAAGQMSALLRPLSPVLAALLDAPELVHEDREEQFAIAVATFVAELARGAGSAVLHLDDVQWLDATTRRVLRHLTYDLPRVPMLVALTARDDAASRPALEAFERDFGGTVQTWVDLGPLDDAAMGRLVAAHLRGAVVTPELSAQIAARSEGNPFTAGEYLRAIVDAGLIRPSWGVWVLDEHGLDTIDLSGDVLDLVIARIAGLGEESRRLLAAAAAMGQRFAAAQLAAVCGIDELAALDLIRVAVERRLIGPGGGETEYVFLHDRIREALLADVPSARQRVLHQRIATVLDATGRVDPETVYAVARHYALGEVERTPNAVFRTCRAAGELALAQHAAQQAVGFLETAAAAAGSARFTPEAGCAPDAAFSGTLGQVYLRTGRLAEARERLEEALAAETDTMRRASLWAWLCEVHHSCYNADLSIAAARRGLAELGRRLPGNPFLLVLSTIGLFLTSLAIRGTGIGFGTAKGLQAERYRLESTLLAIVSHGAAVGRRMLLMSCLVFRHAYAASRLGAATPEFVRSEVHLSGVARMAGWHRLADRIEARAAATARRIGDPRLVAFVEWLPQMVAFGSGVENIDELRGMLAGNGRWLFANEYLDALSCLVNYLNCRGQAIEAHEWWERGRQRDSVDRQALGHPVAVAGATGSAMLGEDAEATGQLRQVREFLGDRVDTREQWVQYITNALQTAVELGELGEHFENVVADMARLGLTPGRVWAPQRFLWVYLAYGRLAQAQAAPAGERPARLAAARAAIETVRRFAKRPNYAAHHRLLDATYRLLAGDPAGALRVLEKADEATRTLDSPLLSYETARVRARALLALGYPTEARRQATLALVIAKEGGWEHRSRWITAEFGVSALYHHVRATGSVAATAAQERNLRRLDALQQVGLVAAKVLDPEQLARVALDETIRVFGAERAFLFLIDEDGDQLVPRVGRDSAGRDLAALTGYSATLVGRVRDGGDALVVTGDEDGRSVASESAVVHGLRSIMVAPLRLADRLLGVVYLDSRVAKGIFTVEDVDVLVAITNHVAVSLETARAAQLEVAVHAARQQRDLAETLRSAMSRISSTLDPDEVLDRLLDTAARTLSADAACLVRHHDGLHTVVGRHGRAATDAVGRRVDPGADPALAAVIEASVATRGTILAGEPAPLGDLLPGTRSWIAVPLATGTEVVGFLVAASGVPERYTDADVDIIATLAGQGMAAYDKARLFEQVRELATVDGLTGVYNRRYALELAERQFAEAGAFAPVAAIMVDIDHFKSVNDTHGHLAGDQVIREVAARLRGAVRAEDVLGRYGGEEFVLVVAAPRAVADELAARVHRAVNGSPIETGAGQLSTTVSVGVAYRRPADRDLGALLSRADRALYIAKEQGRNRVAAA